MILYFFVERRKLVKSNKAAVDAFLEDVREAIRNKRCTPIDRDKNMSSLGKLGLFWSDALAIIEKLTYNDYIKGPEEDRDMPNSDKLWIFKKPFDGFLIYIKIKILYKVDKRLIVVSFHIDE